MQICYRHIELITLIRQCLLTPLNSFVGTTTQVYDTLRISTRIFVQQGTFLTKGLGYSILEFCKNTFLNF